MKNPVTWQLLAKHFAQETSPEENQQIEQWLAEDTSHQQLFNQARKAWQQPYAGNPAFDPNKGLRQLDARLAQYSRPPATSSRTYKMPRWIPWAAMVIVICGLGLLSYLSSGYVRPRPAIEYVEQTTPYGQTSLVTLADGSKVYLNALSKLRYPRMFAASTREVYISGEAFFEVTPNPDKPFLVHSGPLTTKVLGTSFNIKAYAGDSIQVVTVASGIVQVATAGNRAAASQKIRLSPNQQASYSMTSQLTKAQVDAAALIAWKEGMLRFDDTPLGEACRQLERWYGVKIIFHNKAIHSCLLTAQFRNEPLSVVLESMSLSTGIQYTQQGKTIFFKGQGCS